MFGVPGDPDFVLQRVAGSGKIPVVRERAAEQTVGAVVAVDQIDTHVADQHEVGLARLDHEARGHVAVVEVPRISDDVGFSPDGASA